MNGVVFDLERDESELDDLDSELPVQSVQFLFIDPPAEPPTQATESHSTGSDNSFSLNETNYGIIVAQATSSTFDKPDWHHVLRNLERTRTDIYYLEN